MIITHRLEEVRVHLGLKKGEFASILGIHANSYTNYINGSREVPLEILRKVSNTYNISYEWLINGTGSMNKHSALKEPGQEYGNEEYKFRMTAVIPDIDEISSIEKHRRLGFRNESPDAQFLLSIPVSSEYIVSPYINAKDFLLCSAEPFIKDGDLVAVKWEKNKSGIKICNYSGSDSKSLVLTSLNQSTPPIIVESGNVQLYKILLIIKS